MTTMFILIVTLFYFSLGLFTLMFYHADKKYGKYSKT